MNEVGIEKGIRSGSKNVGIKLELKECEKEEKIISFIVFEKWCSADASSFFYIFRFNHY